jgi:hypothetical protein
MFLLFCRYEPCDPSLIQVLQVLLRAIPTVDHHSLRLLSRLLFDRLHQRHQLLFIIRGLRDPLPDDQLKGRFHGDLRVVTLHKSIRPLRMRDSGSVKLYCAFAVGSENEPPQSSQAFRATRQPSQVERGYQLARGPKLCRYSYTYATDLGWSASQHPSKMR